jgi:hypothetical protein
MKKNIVSVNFCNPFAKLVKFRQVNITDETETSTKVVELTRQEANIANYAFGVNFSPLRYVEA